MERLPLSMVCFCMEAIQLSRKKTLPYLQIKWTVSFSGISVTEFTTKCLDLFFSFLLITISEKILIDLNFILYVYLCQLS